MSDYPEHDKMSAVAAQSQAIGQFLDSGSYVLAEYIPCRLFHMDSGYVCSREEHLVPVQQPIEKILAEHFGIDLTKVEAEKQAMLASIREANRA